MVRIINYFELFVFFNMKVANARFFAEEKCSCITIDVEKHIHTHAHEYTKIKH